MDLNIYCIRFSADKKLLSFINKKINKLKIFYNSLIRGEVALKVDGNENYCNKIAEVKINVRGSEIFASKKSSSFEDATQLAIEAVKKQLKKYKQTKSSNK